MSDAQRQPGKRGLWARAGAAALKVLALFIILEPIWMLLPFAGFLYGSAMRIQSLARSSATAWLTHFVFPVLTLGLFGPVLVAAGLGLFLAGAGQIYWAKIRKSGLVTKGIYRWVRHPQYAALTIFGIGILLTWGRTITFLAFFAMMFLYWYLAKSEERNCLRLFGERYERYRERTSFVLPGDRLLRGLGAKLPRLRLPAPIRVAGAFILTMGVCFSLIWLIDALKTVLRTVPYLTATVPFGPADARAAAMASTITAEEANGVAFVRSGRVAVVRGPHRNASQSGFAERVLLRLRDSNALGSFLAFLDDPNGDAAIVFCTPYEKPDQPGTPGMHAGEGDGDRRGPPTEPGGPDRARLMILRCTLSPGAGIADAFADRSKRKIRGGCIAPVDLARPVGEDIVAGEVSRPGPGFPGEQRWDFLLQQLAARPADVRRQAPGAAIPGVFPNAAMVLVQAPILRTRVEPAFAQEILDRLVGSARFRDRLRNSGAGGDVVAVAFPTPGPNWYREHHGRPQISVCVVLVRARDPARLEELFRPGGRVVLGAFFADMDFRIDRSEDCVGEVRPIGPWRDLEERWDFFLSGIGGWDRLGGL